MPLSPRAAVLRRVAVPLTAGALSLTLGGGSPPRATSQSTPSMTTSRLLHTATALADGSVLVAGGQKGGSVA